jgi:NAD(P)-dependent dehydrogenase (short-subunit alcohol dehydrogenase family)
VVLKGRVAVVTGASSGIGRAVAEAYAREGASVALADVDEKAGRAAAADIARRYPGVRAEFVRTDVSDPADCERMVQECTRRLGRLDIACNNAGIGGEANLTADYSVEGWQKVIGINLSGVFYCLKYELQHMLTAGSGAVVNLASILGAVGFAGAPAYVSA